MFHRLAPFALVSALFAVSGCAVDATSHSRVSTTRAAVVDEPCASSASCGAGEYCTTEDGDCDPPPGCEPGSPCPTVCYGTCQKKETAGVPCREKTCGAGEVCCNPSCGICAPRGAACIMIACLPLE